MDILAVRLTFTQLAHAKTVGGGEECRANENSVRIIVLNILRDLFFSRNEPPKSAYD